MRDRLITTRIWLCLVLFAALLSGCEPRDSARQGRSTPADRPTASQPESATGQRQGQELGYISAEPATPQEREGQGPSAREVAVGMTDGLKYAPEAVTITVGQTVVWTNTSSMNHTVTADPARARDRSHVRLPKGAQPFDSGDMAPGATFRHTFDVPGEYVYFCIPHESAGMIGRVNVQEKP